MYNRNKQLLIRFFLIISAGYVLICCLAYFLQEKLIFYPKKIPEDYRLQFPSAYKEMRLHRFLPHSKMPVTIFYGTADEVIYYGSAEKLSNYSSQAIN